MKVSALRCLGGIVVFAISARKTGTEINSIFAGKGLIEGVAMKADSARFAAAHGKTGA